MTNSWFPVYYSVSPIWFAKPNKCLSLFQTLQQSLDQAYDIETVQRVRAITSGLADKAESVKYNLTTNKAEAFMNIRMHFEGGKIVNRSQAGSFTSRAHGTKAMIFQFLCLSFFPFNCYQIKFFLFVFDYSMFVF